MMPSLTFRHSSDMGTAAFQDLCRASKRYVNYAVVEEICRRLCGVRVLHGRQVLCKVLFCATDSMEGHALSNNFVGWSTAYPCRQCCVPKQE
eukprot:scaffold124_cov242-Pinguiococcus_pyrenoidosus.AAC.1